jgi:hypothetical protein
MRGEKGDWPIKAKDWHAKARHLAQAILLAPRGDWGADATGRFAVLG